jgi:hypothetical protein
MKPVQEKFIGKFIFHVDPESWELITWILRDEIILEKCENKQNNNVE